MPERVTASRRKPSWRGVGLGAALVVGVLLVAYLVFRAGSGDTAGRFALDPAIGMELDTLVGKPAPVLQFPDADGRVHTIPTRTRATILIFHMGFF